MFKKQIKLFGGLTPPTPFVMPIEADFALMRRVNTRAKYMQVQVVNLYISKKGFSCIFQAMPTKCIAAECSRTTTDGVSLHGWSDSQEQ